LLVGLLSGLDRKRRALVFEVLPLICTETTDRKPAVGK
jgi:hypothetical protein